MRTPDVVIVGAQKAATTGVFRTLGQHPDIITPRVQEAVNLHAGVEHWGPWVHKYEPQLEGAQTGILIVKLATAMNFSDTLQTIKSLNRRASVIAVLRHPVERMLSLHRYAVQQGLESRAIEVALRDDRVQRATRWRLRSYSGGSRYADAIATLDHVFDRDHVIYLDYDQVASGSWIPQVADFLDLGGPPIRMLRANESRPPKSAALARGMNTGVARSLARTVIPAPWRETVRAAIHGMNSKPAQHSQAGISAGLRAALVQRHLPDVRAAERVLSKELPDWRR